MIPFCLQNTLKKMEKYNLKLSDIYYSKIFLISIAIFKFVSKESD